MLKLQARSLDLESGRDSLEGGRYSKDFQALYELRSVALACHLQERKFTAIKNEPFGSFFILIFLLYKSAQMISYCALFPRNVTVNRSIKGNCLAIYTLDHHGG